jgi:hypothetical protein
MKAESAVRSLRVALRPVAGAVEALAVAPNAAFPMIVYQIELLPGKGRVVELPGQKGDFVL